MGLETTSTYRPEVHRDQIVESLRHSIVEGEHGLKAVPNLIQRAEEARVWEERVVKVTGEVVKKNDFIELVESMPPEGLGANVKLLEGLCRNNPEALKALRRMTKGKVGRPPKNGRDSTNKSQTRDTRDNKAGWLDRLDREHPDLYQQVKEGKISAYAAAVKAGYKKGYVKVPTDVTSAAKSLLKHFDREELIQALRDV